MVEKNNAQMSKIMLNIDLLTFFLDDYNKYVYGRDLERKSNYSQRTIVNKLNFLSEQQILIYKKEGQLKKYSLNFKNPLIINFLQIAQEIKTLEFLKKNFEISDFFNKIKIIINNPILVFGSYSRGEEGKDSDLDILIIGKYDEKLIEQEKKRYPFKIHIINFTKKEFEKGIKNKENFHMELLKNNMLIQDNNYFIKFFLGEING